MMAKTHVNSLNKNTHASSGNAVRYTKGFIFSIVMTAVPYYIVVNHSVKGWQLVAILISFALLQVYVQLQYFLHIGDERNPRWNLMLLSFMIVVVSIVVFGSIWIMTHLSYNHGHSMTPSETDNYIIQDEGVRR